MTRNVLNGKNALVTGATGGLGREIALELASHGCNLYLTGRNAERLEEVKAELSDSKIKVECKTGDQRRAVDIQAVIDDVREKLKHVDILVNCAGVFMTQSIAEATREDFDDCFNVNVRAPFLLSKAFADGMVEKGWGRIVNIGSSSSYSGFKETSIYCASKHALLGFSRSLHDELKEHGVRVFCISPGSIKTRMGKQVKGQDFETFMDPKEIAEYVCFVMAFDKELVSEEIRLNRMEIR